MAKYKYILTVIIILCSLITYAQPAQYTPMTAAGYQMKRLKVDSTLHLPSFCGVPTLRGSTAKDGALAIDTCGGFLYMWTRLAGWDTVNVSGGGGSGGGDYWKTSGTTILTGPTFITSNNQSLTFGAGDQEDMASISLQANEIVISPISGDLKFNSLETTTDTSTYKPLGISNAGVVAPLTSWVGGGGNDTTKVPYTGATKDVNIGTHDLFTNKVFLLDEPNGNYGSIHYTDGDFHIEDADNHKLLVIEDGFMQLHLNDTIQSNIFTTSLTQTRDHFLPNNSGTIALTSDTISLSNRINGKLNISDTASMLSSYSTMINGKLNISDTATMLSSYSTRINGKLNISDTASMLSSYSTRINGKLNISDTATMLSSYSTRINGKLNISDTASMLSSYSTRINGKLNISDANQSLTAYQYLGSTIKAFPIGVTGFANATTSYAHISSRMMLVAIYIPQTTTITGVKYIVTSAGTSYVGNANYNGFVLYDYNRATGLCTRIDSTASDNTIWTTTGTQQKAFVTSISLSQGVYYLGVMCQGTATTFPGIAQNSALLGASTFDLTSPARITAQITGANVPASFNLSTSTLNTNLSIIMLY